MVGETGFEQSTLASASSRYGEPTSCVSINSADLESRLCGIRDVGHFRSVQKIGSIYAPSADLRGAIFRA